MVFSDTESAKAKQLVDMNSRQELEVYDLDKMYSVSAPRSSSNRNQPITRPLSTKEGVSYGKLRNSGDRSEPALGLLRRESGESSHKLRKVVAATVAVSTTSANPHQTPSKKRSRSVHNLLNNGSGDDTEVAGPPAKRARSTTLQNVRHHHDHSPAAEQLNEQKTRLESGGNHQNSQKSSKVLGRCDDPEEKDEERIEVGEVTKPKTSRRNPNAGRNRQSVNLGGTGDEIERRVQKPRYWELHDDCVEAFARGENPRMSHFKDRLNDNGQPFAPNEFRSLKNHANPNRGIENAAVRAKKEEMTRRVLAARAARKASAQNVARQGQINTSPGLNSIPGTGYFSVAPNAQASINLDGHLQALSQALNQGSQSGLSRNPSSNAPISFKGNVNEFSRHRFVPEPIVGYVARDSSNRGNGQMQGQGYKHSESTRDDMHSTDDCLFGFNNTSHGLTYPGYDSSSAPGSWSNVQSTPSGYLYGPTTTAMNEQEQEPFLSFIDRRPSGVGTLQGFQPREHMPVFEAPGSVIPGSAICQPMSNSLSPGTAAILPRDDLMAGQPCPGVCKANTTLSIGYLATPVPHINAIPTHRQVSEVDYSPHRQVDPAETTYPELDDYGY